MAKSIEEFRVIFKLKEQTGDGFRGLNPLKVAEAFKSVGEGVDARALSNGALLVLCKSKEQRGKVAKIAKISGKKVEAQMVEKKEVIQGVIYGVYAEVLECEIKESIKGGTVCEVKRFKAREGGNPNAPVLITFSGNVLPERVFIGCLSFPVRSYQRPPMRCFKCQRFGHLAASCRGNRRCTKCGGEHNIASCSVPSPKCCNCGGCHMASSKDCAVFAKAKRVQEVKEQHKISYAEAVKKVEGKPQAQAVVMAPPNASKRRIETHGSPNQDLVVNKESLMAFIVDVVYGSRGKKSRSDLIKWVVESAGRFLGLKDYAPQLLFGYMKEVQEAQGAQNQSSSQSSTGSGAGDGVEEEEINMEEGGLEAFFGGI
ncbi:unnamed protein product [Knipowitschia caucasica]